MASSARGTFTATGQSAEVIGYGVSYRCTHAGTATIVVQFWDSVAAAWVNATANITATTRITTISESIRRRWRLDCTAYTNDVTYVLEAGRAP